ncbi:MAG: hypothetical protein IPP37_00005 [Saprospiraceae bacterium]|nr:hypothetical protein [Saprospiraceae bacterium]
MNIKTNISFFGFGRVDRGMAQIVTSLFVENEMKENSGNPALIRKYTAGLAFDVLR